MRALDSCNEGPSLVTFCRLNAIAQHYGQKVQDFWSWSGLRNSPNKMVASMHPLPTPPSHNPTHLPRPPLFADAGKWASEFTNSPPHSLACLSETSDLCVHSRSPKLSHHCTWDLTHRVAMADFWRTCHHDGKISPVAGEGGGGGGVHAHPLTLYYPSHTKLQCTF